LTAAATDSQLPAAKRQKQLELEKWQVETDHWTQQQWSDYEAGEQTRRSVEIKDLATCASQGRWWLPAALAPRARWRRAELGARLQGARRVDDAE